MVFLKFCKYSYHICNLKILYMKKLTEIFANLCKVLPYLVFVLVIGLSAILIKSFMGKSGKKEDKQEPKTEKVTKLDEQIKKNPYAVENMKKCEEVIEDVVFFIFYQEGFKHKVYNDNPHNPAKGTLTIGPGLTSYSNGRKVKKGDPDMSIATGEQEVIKFLRKHVFPAMCWVEKKMSTEEIIAISSFVYNVGMESFCHYHSDGTYAPEGFNSKLLESLNNGDSPMHLARYLTGFRNSGGCRANGLLKRHWVEGAILMKALTIDDLLDCEPEKFYGKDVKFYFGKTKPDKDDYFTPNFSKKKIKDFKTHNYSKTKSLRCVLQS